MSDRRVDRRGRPPELDLTLGIAGRDEPFELSVAYERDIPLDHGTYAQQMVFLDVSWSFSAYSNQPAPRPKARAVVAQDEGGPRRLVGGSSPRFVAHEARL